MATLFEKSVTFIGNVVAILTFAFSVLNWFGMTVVVDSTIPNKRIAMAILIAFSFFASYGAAKVLLNRVQHAQSILPLWFLLNFSYVFGFLFLLDKSKPVMQLAAGEDIAIAISMSCNAVLFGAKFFLPQIYPDGFSLGAWFRAGFSINSWKLMLCFFAHVLSLESLFMLLSSA